MTVATSTLQRMESVEFGALLVGHEGAQKENLKTQSLKFRNITVIDLPKKSKSC